MSSTEASAAKASPTRPFFDQGYSCGEALLMASRLEEGPTRETLLRCLRGLSSGRAVTCTLLIAGLLALAERHAPPTHEPRPDSEWLDAFDAPGAPGSPERRAAPQVAEFKARFDARAMHRHNGTTCSLISDVDWGGGRPAALQATFPPEACVQMADAVLEDLNELLGDG